ncbi:CLUMA_CG016993, isoform A [Clunio marinus]|uniref:CLUMA_CG016993, isoform A n=1 Tax=Clunio marinus TaxID=568069 RepID=A0A1J1IZ49_9DIPT|nr:CLUMA_CG016993, isoform A [Clunio marinus]
MTYVRTVYCTLQLEFGEKTKLYLKGNNLADKIKVEPRQKKGELLTKTHDLFHAICNHMTWQRRNFRS